ncbi:multicopper oxidase family protein [Mycolicibacterium brisbanense]
MHATKLSKQIDPPDNPWDPGTPLRPFVTPLAVLHPVKMGDAITIDIAATTALIHPDLPEIAAWGYGVPGGVTSPGPLLEADAGDATTVTWRNRLDASLYQRDPNRPVPTLPFSTAVVDDPDGDNDSVQNYLGSEGGVPEKMPSAPLGWTSTHLHGGHSASDADGWPENMIPAGGQQVSFYANTYDNVDIALGKVGALLWYHDHAMNGTRYHVYSGLAGGYILRDQAERDLGLPTTPEEGEIVAIIQDRNIDAVDGQIRFLHKTTPDTGEFFGPLTLVNGKLWPQLSLRPATYRLRMLNGSNARAYRLHLVTVDRSSIGDQPPEVRVHHDVLRIIGSDGGLLWKAAKVAPRSALTLAPAERLDVLVDLSGFAPGTQVYLINSAEAPFGGGKVPTAAHLNSLWHKGDRPGRNPFPWVLRLDVDPDAELRGMDQPASAFDGVELNAAFRRTVHGLTPHPAHDAAPEISIEGHEHHLILLAETDPPGHLYVQELVEDTNGDIALRLPTDTETKKYRVDGWMVGDQTSSETRVAFDDHVGIRPQLGQWQVFRFVNTTGDTHPLHIHQSQFQPLGSAAGQIAYADALGNNIYDPASRTATAPLLPLPDPGRSYDTAEITGWKDTIRVDPGNVVSVAIRFDVPGRYVYHCHVLEHEDTQMMRPIVVTVVPMDDGAPMQM